MKENKWEKRGKIIRKKVREKKVREKIKKNKKWTVDSRQKTVCKARWSASASSSESASASKIVIAIKR